MPQKSETSPLKKMKTSLPSIKEQNLLQKNSSKKLFQKETPRRLLQKRGSYSTLSSRVDKKKGSNDDLRGINILDAETSTQLTKSMLFDFTKRIKSKQRKTSPGDESKAQYSYNEKRRKIELEKHGKPSEEEKAEFTFSHASKIDKEVLYWLNRLRTDPKSLIAAFRYEMDSVRGGKLSGTTYTPYIRFRQQVLPIRVKEDKSCWLEAISALDSQPSL